MRPLSEGSSSRHDAARGRDTRQANSSVGGGMRELPWTNRVRRPSTRARQTRGAGETSLDGTRVNCRCCYFARPKAARPKPRRMTADAREGLGCPYRPPNSPLPRLTGRSDSKDEVLPNQFPYIQDRNWSWEFGRASFSVTFVLPVGGVGTSKEEVEFMISDGQKVSSFAGLSFQHELPDVRQVVRAVHVAIEISSDTFGKARPAGVGIGA